MLARSGRYGFARCRASLARKGGFASSCSVNLLFPPQLSRRRCLLPRILHSLRPVNAPLSIPDFSEQIGWDEIDVMHLVAVGAKNRKVRNIIVSGVAVQVGDFKNLRNTETAVCADRRVIIEGKLAIVHTHHGVAPFRTALERETV